MLLGEQYIGSGEYEIRIAQISNKIATSGEYETKVKLLIEVAGQVQEVEIPIKLIVSANTIKIVKKINVNPIFSKVYDGSVDGTNSYSGNLTDFYEIQGYSTTHEVYKKIKTKITFDNKNVGERKR